MSSTSSPVRPAPVRARDTAHLDAAHLDAAHLDAARIAAVAPQPVRARVGIYDRVPARLRLLCLRTLIYSTNYFAAYVPSFAFRRLWYRIALGIQIGDHVGVFLGTYLWTYGPRANRRLGIRIGQNTRINRRCTLDVRCGLTIGDNVSISPEVMILGSSHDINDPAFAEVSRGPVVIEDHAFIGTRAIILPGVTVGRGAVVAAGSRVSKDVPPMTIVAGSPARPIGMRDPGATAYKLDGPLPLFE